MKKLVQVAVGVVEDPYGRILIARRPEHLHQGGLWEFPGGKIAEEEDVVTALARELQEEVGITIAQTQPLITIEHDYGDKQVCLHVHRVTRFEGVAHGREGQPIEWVTVAGLDAYEFPAANRGIINAMRLPDRYMITGEFSSSADCLQHIKRAIDLGVRMIQLRAKHLADEDYLQLAKQVLVVQEAGIAVVLNTSAAVFKQTNAAGLHLTSQRLMQIQQRPIAPDKLLSASIHNEAELEQAKRIGVDFILASPVKATTSHPDASMLGWERFAELVKRANCPVYALGGMIVEDLDNVKRMGGHGIAGISLFNTV